MFIFYEIFQFSGMDVKIQYGTYIYVYSTGINYDVSNKSFIFENLGKCDLHIMALNAAYKRFFMIDRSTKEKAKIDALKISNKTGKTYSRLYDFSVIQIACTET